MRKAVETPKPENPLSPGRFERVLLVGTGLRGWHYGQRQCEAASTGRTHGSTDLFRRNMQKALAKWEPSTHGDKQTYSRFPRMSRFHSKADMPVRCRVRTYYGRPRETLRL